MWRADRCLNVFSRTRAGINETASAQLFQPRAIKIKSFALIVRTERTADIRTFLPLKSEPAQVLEHRCDVFRFAARAIQIVVAQDEHSAIFNHALLSDPERSRVTQVQQPGRGGRDASAIQRLMLLGHARELTTKKRSDKVSFALRHRQGATIRRSGRFHSVNKFPLFFGELQPA